MSAVAPLIATTPRTVKRFVNIYRLLKAKSAEWNLDEPELLSRPVDQDLLGGCGWGVLAGSFDEFAVDEGGSGADQGDEVRRVDRAPAVLG